MLTNGAAVRCGSIQDSTPVEHPGRNFQPRDPPPSRSACSGKQTPSALSTASWIATRTQTKDASDKEPRGERSCGRSQTLLYNGDRPHSSLDGMTPDQAYFCGLALAEAA